jgi:hypothetical protein
MARTAERFSGNMTNGDGDHGAWNAVRSGSTIARMVPRNWCLESGNEIFEFYQNEVAANSSIVKT